MNVRRAFPAEIPLCLALREEVFVREQNVPFADEQDGLDGGAAHFVAWERDHLVGTARLRLLPDGRAKAERVAVRRTHRGQGVGKALMLVVEAVAGRNGASAVVLHAQVDALPFYRALGYRPYGEAFLDAGIVHRAMAKVLPRAATAF